MDWRLRDGNVGLHAGKEFCASFCASPIAGLRRAFLCVYRVCLSLREFWLRPNEMHEVRTFAPCEVFLFVCFENYFGFRTTNVKGKTDHSVSLRWNKKLWSFPERRVFFWLSIQLICFAHFRPAELKPACILLLVVTVPFFLHSQIYILPLQNHLYPSLQSMNLANACEWINLCDLNFFGNKRLATFILEKKSLLRTFFCCLSNNSQGLFDCCPAGISPRRRNFEEAP